MKKYTYIVWFVTILGVVGLLLNGLHDRVISKKEDNIPTVATNNAPITVGSIKLSDEGLLKLNLQDFLVYMIINGVSPDTYGTILREKFDRATEVELVAVSKRTKGDWGSITGFVMKWILQLKAENMFEESHVKALMFIRILPQILETKVALEMALEMDKNSYAYSTAGLLNAEVQASNAPILLKDWFQAEVEQQWPGITAKSLVWEDEALWERSCLKPSNISPVNDWQKWRLELAYKIKDYRISNKIREQRIWAHSSTLPLPLLP